MMRTLYLLEVFVRYPDGGHFVGGNSGRVYDPPPGLVGCLPVFDTREAAEAAAARAGGGEVSEFDTDDAPEPGVK